MDGLSPVTVALTVALTFVAYWFVLLTHELGHAAIGLTRTDGLVRVRVGRSPGVWRGRLRRLSLELHPLPARNEPDGVATTHAHFGQASAVLYALAGPCAGCLAALALLLLGIRSHFEPFTIVAGFIFFAELSNLLPSDKHGVRSDGAVLRELLHTSCPPRPAHPLADVSARFLVLVTDARGTLAGGTGGVLLKVLNALDRDPNDRNSPEAVGLVRMAFSGWCWREAERGDTAPIRDSVLDARHRAVLMGLSQADVAGWAAAELARKTDLAAASPSPDALEYGFRRARWSRFTDGVPEQHAEFAFRFGVAMHDVRTIAG